MTWDSFWNSSSTLFRLETFTYSDVSWLEFLLFQFEELFCFHHEGLKCMVCFCILHCAPPFGSFMHVFFKDLFRARKFYIVGFSWVGIIYPPGFLPFVGIISFLFFLWNFHLEFPFPVTFLFHIWNSLFLLWDFSLLFLAEALAIHFGSCFICRFWLHLQFHILTWRCDLVIYVISN